MGNPLLPYSRVVSDSGKIQLPLGHEIRGKIQGQYLFCPEYAKGFTAHCLKNKACICMVTNMIPKASRAHLLFLNKVVQHTSKWKGLTIITILSFGRTREENISFSFISSCVACWGEIIQGFVQQNPENCSTNLGGGRPLDSTDDSNTSSCRSGCP